MDYLFRVILAGEDRGPLTRTHHALLAGERLAARSAAIDELADHLESQLALFVAEISPLRVFVHAGVVGWRGRAVVIPGRSFSGKSTLVAELIRRGARYYSDEYAVLDGRGRAHPYPRPLALRVDHPYRSRPMDPGSLGGRAGRSPLPVGAVVCAPYRKGASCTFDEMSCGTAVLELLANAVGARRQPQRVLPALRATVAGSRCWRGARGESSEAADEILRLLDGRPQLRTGSVDGAER